MSEWIIIALFLIAFLLVHLSKMTRLYLVLMEQKISFRRFVLIYLQTTFVNLLVPFKLGELFRVYCLGRETKRIRTGILSVLVDRFFDTAALLVILIPFQLFITEKVTGIALVMFAAVVLLMFVYRMFGPTYLYLNHYIIKNKSSVRSMTALRALDHMENGYEYIKELVAGRSQLIILFSCLGWGFEIAALYLLSVILHLSFGIMEISTYIAAIFLSEESVLLTTYTWIGAAMIGLATVLGYIFFRKNRRCA